VLTIDIVAAGQILGALATFAAIITFLRAQKKSAQDEGAAMQRIQDMQDKLVCHDEQLAALEHNDKEKDIVIAEVNTKLQHISKQIDELAARLEKYLEEARRLRN